MERLSNLWRKIEEIKADIRQKAHDVLEEAKHTGRKALTKLADVLYVRDGLNRVQEKEDKMIGELDDLQAKVDRYVGEKQIAFSETPDKAVDQEQTAKQPDPLEAYQEEMRKFFDNCVTESREYGSNSEAYEAFKNYYERWMKSQGQTEMAKAMGKAATNMTKQR